eukprot:m.1441828 g.1441828  ORF g.1441828 m.1441828 type:complete len:775 (-) comp25095_c0_seq6:4291-6615(-)
MSGPVSSGEQADEDRTRAENLAYFQRVEQMLNDQELLEDDEQRDVFVQNVLAEVEGSEVRSCCDMVCSRVLERLIQVASAEHVRHFFRRVIPMLEKLLGNRYASHVVQTLVVRAAAIVEVTDVPDMAILGADEELPEDISAITLVHCVCHEFQQYLPDYISSTYGSHVLRATIAALAGLAETSSTRSKASRNFRKSQAEKQQQLRASDGGGHGSRKALTRSEVPSSFVDMLQSLTRKVMGNDPQLQTWLVHPTAAAVVQTLLDALHTRCTEACAQLCEAIAKPHDAVTSGSAAAGNAWFGSLMNHKIGSHVVEKVLQVCSQQMHHTIYTAHFRGKMKDLSLDSFANFIVARLIETAHTPEEVNLMVDELYEILETILAANHPGVIIKLVDACAKHQTRQQKMFKGLLQAFHAEKPDDIKLCGHMFVSMTTCDNLARLVREHTGDAPTDGDGDGDNAADTSGGDIALTSNTVPMVYDQHGARLVQALLRFSGTEVVRLTSSLLSLDGDVFVKMARHAVGSHVLEGLLSCDISVKKKTKLLNKFKGSFSSLAMDKFGSHVVDRCWSQADIKTKEWVAAEFLDNEEELQNNFHGRLILRNCKIDYFKRKREDWVQQERGNERKRKVFDEFYSNGGGSSKGTAKTPRKNADEEVAKPTRAVDKDVAALGFGAHETLDDGAGSAVEDTLDETLLTKAAEIDDLFDKKKRKKLRKSEASGTSPSRTRKDTGSTAKAAAAELSVKKSKKMKKKKKEALSEIFAAVEATKKSKKKKSKKSKK